MYSGVRGLVNILMYLFKMIKYHVYSKKYQTYFVWWLLFNFPDADATQVSVCVCLFFVALFAVLRWLPKCFTIGEAMVITESLVLLSVDSFTDLGIKVNFVMVKKK